MILHFVTHLVLKIYPSIQVVESRDYTRTTLEEDVYSVLNWGQQNQVKFNTDKLQLVIFSNRNNTDTDIVFQKMTISDSSSFSLLVIDINCRLSWTM